MKKPVIFKKAIVAAVAFAGLLPVAWSQAYPVKPLTAILTLPAGSTVDVLARVFSQQIEPRLKQPMIVDNKPGAGLMLGMQAVAAAPADGYTMAFSPATPLMSRRRRRAVFSSISAALI